MYQFGFYLNDGQDLISLPNYLIGADVTGSSSEYSVQSATPLKDISREIGSQSLSISINIMKSEGGFNIVYNKKILVDISKKITRLTI